MRPIDDNFLDMRLESYPGRGWIVNDKLSIFRTRSGYKLFAGPNGANDCAEETFEIAAISNQDQFTDLMSGLGL